MEEGKEGKRIWKCSKCKCELVPKKVLLDYLGYSITHELPTCPSCGKVYVSGDLAEGRMCQVEQTLEDK